MDLKTGDDIYDSFRAHQNKLLREYPRWRTNSISKRRRPPLGRSHPVSWRQVGAFLEPTEKPALARRSRKNILRRTRSSPRISLSLASAAVSFLAPTRMLHITNGDW
jgi:hypothetical protein